MGIRAKLLGLLATHGAYWLGLFTVLAGVLYCSAAAYTAMRDPLGVALAALVTGLILLAVALTPLVIGIVHFRRQQEQREEMAELEAQLRKLLGDGAVRDWLQSHATGATFAALAVGVVTGASPSARAGMLRLLQNLSQEN